MMKSMKTLYSYFIAIGCILSILSCDQQRQAPESGPSIQAASASPKKSETKERRGSAFKDFATETENLNKAAQCAKGKVTPAEEGLGALFTCIEGEAQTAKLFVNGKPNSTQVENVKVMWNDWFKDTGYGLHPDRSEAERLLTAVVKRYAPELLPEVKAAFFGKESLTTSSKGFKLEVTHSRGPAIEERLLTVTEKQ